MLIDRPEHLQQLDWNKGDGLLPAMVQDAWDGRLLMQAWMNPEALETTLQSGRVTFWSRSRQALWTKGETSGNTLQLRSVHADCDRDSLLILAQPEGPTCHRGTNSCWDEQRAITPQLAFLARLERLIEQRQQRPPPGSYTAELFASGVRRIAQKVGEEGVETALAGAAGNNQEVCDEAADLLYHLLVLLRARGLPLAEVVAALEQRHDPNNLGNNEGNYPGNDTGNQAETSKKGQA